MTKKPSVTKLADELFRRVETAQGLAFISDGMHILHSRTAFFDVVRGHLHNADRTASIIRAFLREHGEL